MSISLAMHFVTGKVFRNADVLFGIAGWFRWAQVLRYAQLPLIGNDVDYYVSVALPKAMRKAANKMGWGRNTEDGAMKGGDCLFGLRGRLFLMQDTFDSFEARDGIMAVGAGYPYAISSLKSTEGEPPLERIRLALQVAEFYCSGVKGPFVIEVLHKDADHSTKTGSHRRRN